MNSYTLCIVSNRHTIISLMARDMSRAIGLAYELLQTDIGHKVDGHTTVNDTTVVFEGFGFNAALMRLNPED